MAERTTGILRSTSIEPVGQHGGMVWLCAMGMVTRHLNPAHAVIIRDWILLKEGLALPASLISVYSLHFIQVCQAHAHVHLIGTLQYVDPNAYPMYTVGVHVYINYSICV